MIRNKQQVSKRKDGGRDSTFITATVLPIVQGPSVTFIQVDKKDVAKRRSSQDPIQKSALKLFPEKKLRDKTEEVRERRTQRFLEEDEAARKRAILAQKPVKIPRQPLDSKPKPQYNKAKKERFQGLQREIIQKEKQIQQKIEDQLKKREEEMKAKSMKYEEKRLSVLQKKEFLEAIHEKDAFQSKDHKEQKFMETELRKNEVLNQK